VELARSKSQQWSITKIQCQEWLQSGDLAFVWASNWADDSISFEMSWHPDGYSVYYNIELDFLSDDVFPYQGDEIVKNYILAGAERALAEWWALVIKMRKLLAPDKWQLRRGLPSDEYLYAGLAYLYAQRAEMFPLSVTKLLSEDMSVPLSTTKERIRKSREKGFLSKPGKGLNGQGEVTKKAIKLLEKEGVIDAKKSK
jgi:hypothetical protein